MIFRTRGKDFSGFDEMRVFQSMETISDGFNFKARTVPTEIKAGREVEILIAGEKKITGFYDQWTGLKTGKTSISGKDKAGRLTNSYPAGTGEFVGQTAKQIIEKIAEPFDITVSGLDGPTIKRFNYFFDTSNASIIRTICTQAGLLASSDSDGNIVLTDARSAKQSNYSFVEGQNVTDMAIRIDLDRRHSDYNIYAQSRFSAFLNAEKVLQSQEGLSSSYAPFNKLQPNQYEIGDAEREALWQQQYNDGSSIEYDIVIPEIIDAEVNTLTTVSSPYLGVDGNLLIRDIEFTSKARKLSTKLTLVSPLTYGGAHTECSHVV